MKSRRFLALSLPNCPQCDELATALETRVPNRQSVFEKWDKSWPEYPGLKAALSIHAGEGFTFPQVFADGVYQGGFHDVMEKLKMGAYDTIFEECFNTEPTTVKRWVESKPMVMFSLTTCPQCDDLKALLKDRGVPVETIVIKWDKAWPWYQSLKAQLIKLTGVTSFTFPQTFVRSEYQGDFHDMCGKLNEGSFDDFFFDAFGIAKPAPAVVPAENFVLELEEDF